MRIQFSRRSPQRPELVYLAIDNASTQLDGFFPDEIEASPALRLMKEPFPWKRTIYPILIDRLVQAGAKVVAFDMLFPSPRENDGDFRAALDKHRDRVVIGANFTDAERGVTLRNFTVPATWPLDDFQALEETAYLLRSPANARRLLAAMQELEAGKGKVRKLAR